MSKLKPGILLAAIITLVGLTSQVALADSHTSSKVVVVIADGYAVSESEDGVDLVKSFLGLVSTLRDGQLFAFVNADEPTKLLGPAVAGSREFKSFQKELVDSLESSRLERRSDLVSALAETYNLLGSERAAPGSTVYLITSAASDADPIQLSERLKPVAGLLRDQGWPVVGLNLPASSPHADEVLSKVTVSFGEDSFDLSVPDGFKSLSDKILRDDAKGSLAELSQGVLSPNAVLTSSLGIAPGTSEATLLFFKEGQSGSLRLTNPHGFEASAGDRTASTVIETPYVVIWKLIDPAPGEWRVDISGIEGFVSTWYHVANKYSLALESFGSVPLDEPISLVAFVTDGREKAILEEAAGLTAIITSPNGTTLVHELNDDGGSGDSVPGDGYYSAIIPPVAVEGEYNVELQLSWPQFDHRISSPASFRAQAFPAIELTQLKTGDLQPGESSKVGTIFVHVQGQPYAISTDQLASALASDLDQAGALEIKPRRVLDEGRAWEYDVFFTPDQEGLHTLVLRLNTEYAGKQYTYTSDTIVLSSVMPPPPPVPEIASVPVAPPPVTIPAPQLPPLQPQPEPSGLPWGLLGGSIAVVAVLAASALYWYTRTRPYGYLYDDRDEEIVADFGSLKRRPIMNLLFKNYVRGKELGIAGLEGVWFSFSGKRIGLSNRRPTPTIRVNNQPVIGKTGIQDGTWIGVHGRLYSFLLSPSQLQMEPGVADD